LLAHRHVQLLSSALRDRMFLSRFFGAQGGGRRTPDENGAKLFEAGLPFGFSLKQGYRPYMEDVYVAQKFLDPKEASNVRLLFLHFTLLSQYLMRI
jgi:hypothetical protein